MYYRGVTIWLIASLAPALCIPEGYILKVLPMCGESVDNVTEVQVRADFHISAEVLCKDYPDARPEPLTTIDGVMFTIQVKPEGNSSECSFFKRNSSSIYTIQLEVSYGEMVVGKKIQKQQLTYMITCTYDQKGINVPETSSRNIIKSYVRPEEIQRNMGIEMNGTFQLHIVDVLDRTIVGHVPLGRKVRLKATLDRIDPLECVSGWQLFKGNCYKFFSPMATYTFPEAEALCHSMGAIIANAKDEETHNFLHILRGAGRIWLGLKDNLTETTWLWSDGSPVTFFNWDGGEPNNSGDEDCVELYQDTYWNDISCIGLKRFVVCEKAALPGDYANDIGEGVRAVSCSVSGYSKQFALLRAGCGSGIIFKQERGFKTFGHTVYSPYFKMFKLPRSNNLLFTCNYTVCETNCDGDSCTNSRRKRSSNVFDEDFENGNLDTGGGIDIMSAQLMVYTESCDPPNEVIIGDGGFISCGGIVNISTNDTSLGKFVGIVMVVMLGQMLTGICLAAYVFKQRRCSNVSPYVSHTTLNF